MSQFSHLYHEDQSIYLTVFWQGLNMTINVRFLEQCPVYNMHSVNVASYDYYHYQIKANLLWHKNLNHGVLLSL